MEQKNKRKIIMLSSISGYISYFLGKYISDALSDDFWIKCVIRISVFVIFVALLFAYYSRLNKK